MKANILCKILGHKPKCENKWRKDCPNAGLYTCQRCGRATITLPLLLDTAKRGVWRDLSDYRHEVYVEF